MSRPRRLPSFTYTGPAIYFLTFCAAQRRAAFLDSEAASLSLSQFRSVAVEESFAILVYCLMPDHVHLLVEGRHETSDLRRFARLVKQRSGWAHRERFGTSLWQEGYFERTLRPHENPKAIARYIVNNPVRAGLVEVPTDYPHIGSDSWTIPELLESLI